MITTIKKNILVVTLALLISIGIGLFTGIDYMHYQNVEQVLIKAGYSEYNVDHSDGQLCTEGYSRNFRGIDKNGMIVSGYVCIFPKGKTLIGEVSEVRE